MKKNFLFLSVMMITAIFISCKKENKIEPSVPTHTPDITYPNYSQLKVGNYWIYQRFQIDTNGISIPLDIYDSCYVEKDTIINGKTYFKKVTPDPFTINQNNISFQRDSLHYIVNSNGKILFSSQDFSTIFESGYQITKYTDTLPVPDDTIYQITKQMADKNMIITTPAGTFTTLNAKATYLMYPKWSAYAGKIRNRNTRYAENVGIVIETLPFWIGLPTYRERRLLRYHVK